LGEGNEGGAAVWGLAQACFLAFPEAVARAGFADGNALFDAIFAGPSAVTFSVDEYGVTWDRMDTPDGKVNLVIRELLDEFAELPSDGPDADDLFPFVLSAGERRSSTANTILRDPTWMKADHAGALRMSPGDAAKIGVTDGDGVIVETKRGRAETVVEITDTLRDGHVSLPNGRGLSYPDDDGVDRAYGIAPNELTAVDDRDWLALTPHHKTVRARVEAAV